MNSARTVTSPAALLAAGIDLNLEPTEAEIHARHLELRQECARRSEFELFCWKIVRDLPPEERETARIPDMLTWEMFYRDGGHHA